MKNSVKSDTNKTDSPKTPGGISKSHLTPIRRLGLSRNWRKSGSSPFISPLSGSNTINSETPPTVKEHRKRKELVEDENSDIGCKVENKVHDGLTDVDDSDTPSVVNKTEHNIVATPTSAVSLPRKKKSKISYNKDDIKNINVTEKKNVISPQLSSANEPCNSVSLNAKVEDMDISENIIEKSIEVKTKSKPRKSTKKKENVVESPEVKAQVHVDASNNQSYENKVCNKVKSPKDLTKECIVVIQKKIFENELNAKNKESAPSQVLFDSDSDDVPLVQLPKHKSAEVKGNMDTIDDDDFIEPKLNLKMLKNKTTSTTGLKVTTSKKKDSKSLQQHRPKGHVGIEMPKNTPAQAETFDDQDDDDDDFYVNNKRTILIRKTYEKVPKLSRARSTGSITQKDIDDLKARIEMKKKLLMAKVITKDTEELRELIRKWQKGCQDALAELMDLMKMKFPEKRNMDYSEILETLKIPANLVGYDSDNDCFVTPTDEHIILSKLNELS